MQISLLLSHILLCLVYSTVQSYILWAHLYFIHSFNSYTNTSHLLLFPHLLSLTYCCSSYPILYYLQPIQIIVILTALAHHQANAKNWSISSSITAGTPTQKFRAREQQIVFAILESRILSFPKRLRFSFLCSVGTISCSQLYIV